MTIVSGIRAAARRRRAADLTDIGTGANTFAAATVDGMARTVFQFPEGNS